jgi:hypothetical protein
MPIALKMMTNDSWYQEVSAIEPLTQEDIILDCPLVQWIPKPFDLKNDYKETLKSLIGVVRADVVVITQACDLEQNKVSNVTLCPHLPLEEYKNQWQEVMNSKGQYPTAKAWVRTCEDIKNGYLWNLSMLNEGTVGSLTLTHRVVDFLDVYTLPRIFLESLLKGREQHRLRLLPPYREHLSQAFARFFIRVGLPTGIAKIW